MTANCSSSHVTIGQMARLITVNNPLRKTLTIIPCLLSLTLIVSAQSQQPQAPKTGDDYVALGIAAQRAGKHEEAVQLFAAALKLNPKHFVAQFNSGAS